MFTILAGAHGMVEVNTRLRSDEALQRTFGREACAEQSVIQETLDACNADNVSQMQEALDELYRRHSQGYQHDYEAMWQLLDADMSGLPCGPKAAFATKGYFAKARNRRGRQLARVLASHYDEVVVDQLYAGKAQLSSALQPLLLAAEQTLALDEGKRQRTIVRVDAGGGSLDDVNWLLARGYQLHCKDYAAKRARKLAESVMEWVDDPRVAGRQVGWVTASAPEYVRPIKRIAVRCRKKNGQWAIGVLISSLPAEAVLQLTGQAALLPAAEAELLAYVYFYDQRGGAVETAIKGDKQGLGISKRNKKRFEAQQLVMLLGTLAHNVVVWARRHLLPQQPKLSRYGIERMLRDIFQISGFVVQNERGHIIEIVLNQAAPLVKGIVEGLRLLLEPAHVAVNLGKT